MRKHLILSLVSIAIICFSLLTVEAQQTSFTYQGKLNDGGSAANGRYDLQFALFDSLIDGAQVGATQTVSNVTVSGGIFTASLDFGASAFTGANRFLEISARPTGAGAFTLLTPRQAITSTPYALRSVNADTATNAQQLAGIAASEYVKTDDARLSDARDPKAGNPSYVQNSTSQQAATNFNISGNGTAGGTLSGNAVNAATQYNLGGQPVLSVSQNLLKLGNTGNVVIGQSFFSNYKLDVESPDNHGLRVGNAIGGGTALSVGGTGNVEVDAPNVPGGRFLIQQGTGNVGIGTTTPLSKLTVQGTVESTLFGFKFPDGTLQTTAAGKTVTTGLLTSPVDIANSGGLTAIATITPPPGLYLLMATVQFENKSKDLLADNSKIVTCWFVDNDFAGTNHLGAPGNPMDKFTATLHTVFTQTVSGQAVSLRCGNLASNGQVTAQARRLTAVRIEQ